MLSILALVALAQAQTAQTQPAQTQPAKPRTPSEIIAQAPAAAWRAIPADDLLLVELKTGGRVTIQLAPQFAPVHVANIKALARANWWDGATIYRVQDNYVVQWGNNESEKPVPKGVVEQPPAEYSRPLRGLSPRPLGFRDSYAHQAGHALGWQVAWNAKAGQVNLTHCYGSVGVGRGLSPDTGMGGELYAVIGHAPRHLDRNIAVVGRVIDGIDHFSSLPRGTEALGFYAEETQHIPIARVVLASQLPAAERPSFEYLDTGSASFGAYVNARANRRDDFFIEPAGGVDVCNAPVPIRLLPER